MGRPNINVNVGGPVNSDLDRVYEIKYLKPNIPFEAQVSAENTKYIVRFNYGLGGASVTIPQGCLIEFDGGSVSNGTLVGQNTILIYSQDKDTLLNNVELLGTFIHRDGSGEEAVVKAIEALDSSVSASSSDNLVTVGINESNGKITSVNVNTNNIAKASEVAETINELNSDINDRMEAFEELVDVSIAGGDIGIINSVDSIKAGQGKVPTGNAVAGLASFVSTSKWLYTITDNIGHIVFGVKEDGKVYGNGLSTINIIVDKNGGGDYTSLSEALIDTYGKKDIVITIMPGTYNIIEEMEAIHEGFWENYDYAAKITYSDMYYDYGLRLGNGITLIGTPGTYIECKYNGNNDLVKMWYSPFNTHIGGFTMINLNIECKNVRYCVHDERGDDETPYTVVYDSCRMESNNKDNSVWPNNACIGGGLGLRGRIKVTNCVFKTAKDRNPLVSYHDSNGRYFDYSIPNYVYANPESSVICTGNYIDGKKGFEFLWHTKQHPEQGYNIKSNTKILCYGNSVGERTIIAKADTGDRDDQDIEVLEWNNELRS